jgi:protein arginine kinase activator
MQCQSCHKNIASVRYAEIVDGQVIEQHVCQECVKDKQDNTSAGFEFAKPSPFMRQDKTPINLLGRSVAQRRAQSCQACSTDLATIKTNGTVGCSVCYETFGTAIDSLLANLHTHLIHTGKIPHQDDARARARADLQAKRTLLKSSLSSERYEEAATLRDEIRALEQGLNTANQENPSS